MTDEQEQPRSDEETIARLRETADSYVGSLERTRPMTEAAQRHQDTVLTWSIGLMGGGLFGLPTVLSNLTCSWGPAVPLVATPWAVGVLVALLGRFVSAKHREADAFHYAATLGRVRALVVSTESSVEAYGNRLLSLMRDRSKGARKRKAKAEKLGRWAEAIHYGTLVLFGLGIVAVFWAVTLCHKVRP